ncbi:MAG: hypothetical protein ACR2LT_06635 [Pyrinomonadaceae bacterium]
MTKQIKNFGFLLFPYLEKLDLVGPCEMFSIWRDYTGEPENCLPHNFYTEICELAIF